MTPLLEVYSITRLPNQKGCVRQAEKFINQYSAQLLLAFQAKGSVNDL